MERAIWRERRKVEIEQERYRYKEETVIFKGFHLDLLFLYRSPYDTVKPIGLNQAV